MTFSERLMYDQFVLYSQGSVMPSFTQNTITMFQCKNAKRKFL